MEHSALHALLLIGFLTLLGGPLFVGGLLRPAAQTTRLNDAGLIDSWSNTAARWAALGALAAAGATFLDFFIQAAEIEGQTIFAGADLRLVWSFVTETHVGQLGLSRLVLLLLAAAATRLRPSIRWPLVTLFGLAALLVTGFVSHAAAQPTGRPFALFLQLAHLVAAAGWIGILLQLFFTRAHWLADPTPPRLALLAEIVRRFSPIALTCSAALALTGLIAASRFLHDTGALFTSAYGITLLVKLTLLGPVVAAGFLNYRTFGPQLRTIAQSAAGPPAPLLPRFARNLELEVTAALLVLTVAGILGSISPPSANGALRLTSTQTQALLQPSLPATSVENWDEPEDPRGPTLVDLRYSEFTHNWSGVLVSILGLGWLLQSSGERLGRWAGRAIALLLVAFGLGIAVAANPEIWLLRTVSPWEMFTNPLLLEHQLGAALVFILAWLGWRDLRRPAELRPLGYALPIIMIAGSLLLLGHAHSTSSVPEDLSTLINVQHAFFGTCGLFAGTIRWLQLRDLIPASPARFLCPAFVLLLGLYMTFFYQEAV